ASCTHNPDGLGCLCEIYSRDSNEPEVTQYVIVNTSCPGGEVDYSEILRTYEMCGFGSDNCQLGTIFEGSCTVPSCAGNRDRNALRGVRVYCFPNTNPDD